MIQKSKYSYQGIDSLLQQFKFFPQTQQAAKAIISDIDDFISTMSRPKSTLYIFQAYRRSQIRQSPELFQLYDLYIDLMPLIQSWSIQSFSVKLFKPNDKILKIISGINFPNLKIIDLFDNQISSIESLAWLRGNNDNKLTYLALRNNKITSLKPFVKCFFKNLKHITLSENPVNHSHLDALSKSYLRHHMSSLILSIEIISAIKIQTPHTGYDNPISMFKFRCKQIQLLTIESNLLITNQNILKKLNNHKLKPQNNIYVFGKSLTINR